MTMMTYKKAGVDNDAGDALEGAEAGGVEVGALQLAVKNKRNGISLRNFIQNPFKGVASTYFFRSARRLRFRINRCR